METVTFFGLKLNVVNDQVEEPNIQRLKVCCWDVSIADAETDVPSLHIQNLHLIWDDLATDSADHCSQIGCISDAQRRRLRFAKGWATRRRAMLSSGFWGAALRLIYLEEVRCR